MIQFSPITTYDELMTAFIDKMTYLLREAAIDGYVSPGFPSMDNCYIGTKDGAALQNRDIPSASHLLTIIGTKGKCLITFVMRAAKRKTMLETVAGIPPTISRSTCIINKIY